MTTLEFDDLDQIMRIMAVAFDPQWGEAWNRRQVSDSLTMPQTHYCLLDSAGAVPADGTQAAGFTLVRAAPGEEELLLIAVDPQHRGKGIGRALLDAFIAGAKSRGAERVFLEMRENNPAVTLYESVGFAAIGRRPDYYSSSDGTRITAITFGMDV